jgi:light-regulated signal transduction histidine kinase (bacteriophytochrome)
VVTDDANEVSRIVGVTRDITSFRNPERERERNIRELNRSNKELEEFAYVASHDLQEPLRKIATFSERMKAKFYDKLGSDGAMYLDRIMSSTENMRILIDNLLEFSRATRSTRAFEPCDLNVVIKDVINELELRIEEAKAKVRAEPLPALEAVPTEMHQLFNNVIANAIKFRSAERTPSIFIRSEKLSKAEKDKNHLRVDQNYVKIIIKDNGIGFEPDYQDKIFQIFQRLHGKAEYPGSGVGLAICKKIVDNHEGVIYAESNLGVGSTFVVILPEKHRI